MRRLRIPLSIVLFIVLFIAVLFDIREVVQIHDHGYPPTYGIFRDGVITVPQWSFAETVLYTCFWAAMLLVELGLFWVVLRLWRKRT